MCFWLVRSIDSIVSSRVGTPVFWGNPPPIQGTPPPMFMRAIQIGACKFYETLKWRFYVLYYTKSIEENIIITLYTFRLTSVFTTDTCFG